MAPTVTVTFVRHGESTDNLRNVWAGWKDAPLSNHGMAQAKAIGESLSNIRFTAIHASPLKRAYSTADAIHQAQPEPKPQFQSSLLLREQHWGIAEGNPWIMKLKPGLTLDEHYAQGIFPVLHERWHKFPEGESLDDLAVRAKQAIDEVVLPHVWTAAKEGMRGIHIAVVSHGLCISELIPALLRKDHSGMAPPDRYRGLRNTAWARLTVDIKGWDGQPLEFSQEDLPPLVIKVTDFNRSEHLDGVKRQQGGIGSAAFDPKQKDIRAFFGGAKINKPLEEGRSESNALDEADVDIE
ncbi:Histidine phosphatase superfamily protein [Abortiporus biennis]